MTNEDFLKEALASSNCPSNFAETYERFCRYQQIEIKMMQAFSMVCQKNNIPYHLAFGSLLGAVRDNGQIPWDYDVDVVVPYYAKQQLYQALDRDLDKEYCYYAPEKDPTYRTSFARIVPRGYPNQMLHVDVFYAIGIPDQQAEREEYCRNVRELFKARIYTVECYADYRYSFSKKAERFAQRMKYFLKYGKKAKADHTEFFSKYDIRSMKDSVVISSIAGKKIDPSSWHLKTVPFETREGTFQIPEEYEAFLKSRYGDWKQYAPIEKRIAEVVHHCNQFSWQEEMRKNLNNSRIKR